MSISCFLGKKKKVVRKSKWAIVLGHNARFGLMPPPPNLLSPASSDSRRSCCCATPVIGEAAGGWPALSHQTAAGCRIFRRRRRLQNNLLTSDKLFKAKRNRCDPRRCRWTLPCTRASALKKTDGPNCQPRHWYGTVKQWQRWSATGCDCAA